MKEHRDARPSTRVLLTRALLLGIAFGFLLVRSEAASWYRIQEMFRFQSFHMYGILGGAVLTGTVSLRVIRAAGWRTPAGAPCELPPKETGPRNTRYWLGGAIFGLGWGVLGACPGPIYALIGAGYPTMLVALAAALAGTYAYGVLAPRLPHY